MERERILVFKCDETGNHKVIGFVYADHILSAIGELGKFRMSDGHEISSDCWCSPTIEKPPSVTESNS